MPAIIVGCDGQLGCELMRRLPDAIGFSRQQLDISNPEAVTKVLAPLNPKRIINCAAYNQVDLAETETADAWLGNTIGPRNLANFSRKKNCQLVQISTDFVFGANQQKRTPYTELDTTGPLSVYGTTKLAGEQFVLASSPDHLVIRSCGLYGSGGNGNFVKTMLKLASQKKPLRVVNDQTCSPTSISDLADGILRLIEAKAKGLYHFANEGEISWYEFANRIFEIANIEADLSPISSQEFGAPAGRPVYSALNCTKYQELTGRKIQSIDNALQCYLSEILKQ